ncbi:MAG: methionine--tRNA ligase [Nanoarchaeota archaeon]|nr:methionine--tRNA ligase [Nanoarchaeota archaeon]
MKKEKRLITVALPYTNNVPHIGNVVGSHLPGDIFARYCRLIGHDAILIGGTDDHGTAIEIAAQKYGKTPKELTKFYYKIHKNIYDWFNISYDNFSRTDKKIHHETAKEFFLEIYKKGYIIEKELKLPYCKDCNKQLSDRYIEGTCPECGHIGARGDQCEKCSSLLEPEDLIKPYCAICGSIKIEFKERKHLFFALDKISKDLEKWIKPNKIWRSQVKQLALSWLKEGLKPRCISRDLKWGIDLPLKEYKDLKFYVWFEAPIGYISSTKEWNSKKWKQYWTGKSKMYHFIGKDNIPFHAIFFPGELIANGKYNLPYNVVGLQYLNYERSKFSKSKNWGVFCENLPNAGLDADYWRFYLAYLIPETKDTEFLWKDFQLRINTELIGNFGNFINRTLSFTKNYFNKKIPSVTVKDKKFVKQVEKQIDVIIKEYENVELKKALFEILKLSDMGNKYFEKKEPWKTKDPEVVFIGANICKCLALLIQPFIPESSQKILKILNCKEKDWKNIKKFNLKNHKIKEPEIIFKKLEYDKIEELKEKTSKVTQYFENKEENKMPEQEKGKELEMHDKISFEEFQKIDLRVGKITKIQPHPDADKLYILMVDLGEGEHDIQLVAGLKGYYKEDELVGKQVVVVRNLQPAVLRGVESQGMLLAAEFKGKVVLLSPEKEIETGAKIR